MKISVTSGPLVDLEWPDPDLITIEDIATALSRICRFTGHGNVFYSVAEHSLRASYLVPPHLELAALLHDATEAYLGDVSSPLKARLGFYGELEYRWANAIAHRFRVPAVNQYFRIREADRYLCKAEATFLGLDTTTPEWRDFPTHPPVWHSSAKLTRRTAGWAPDEARARFLTRFWSLTDG